MAFPPYQRISAFREATMMNGEADRFPQRSMQPTASNIYPGRAQLNYKPFILRHASLLTLLLVAGALIGLLEYAVIQLPHSSTSLTARSIKSRNLERHALSRFERRQESSQNTSTVSSSILENTLESAYVQTSSTAAVSYTTAASAYVNTVTTITTSQSSQPTPNTLIQTRSDYVPTRTTSDIHATTSQSDCIPTNLKTASRSPIPTSLTDEGKGIVVYRTWDAERTFLGTYLAISIAVIYRMLWMMVYNSFNLIDPFLQLMQPGGARAETAFFSFFQSQSNLLGPLPAVFKKRWMLAFVAAAYTIAGLLPAFVSESIFVDTNWGCPNPDLKHKNNPCNPRISADITVIRILQGLLAFTVVALIGISVYLAFKRTGLPTDPRSMATIGSLMQHPSCIDDLNGISVGSTRDEMKQSIGDKTYTLGYFKSGIAEQTYGIKAAVEDRWSTSSRLRSFKYTAIEGYPESTNRTHSISARLRTIDLLLLFSALGAFGVVLAYYLDGNSDGFNDFFNSNTFGPRFILTLVGTVIASMWKSVEQTATIMAPFSRMAEKASRPQGTILFIPSSTPISSTWRSLKKGYVVVTIITLITLLADLGLNITISGVPFASGQTWQQFIVSTYVSLAILGMMIITSAIVIISRFREPRIPRRPDTLGPLMSYLSGSRMLDDLAGTEHLDARNRDRVISPANKMYEFKEALRIDGKVAWKVDERAKSDSNYIL